MQEESNNKHNTSLVPSSFTKATEWNNKSLESAKRGDWTESIRTASVALYLDPSLVSAYVNRCHALLEHGDLDEAMQDCDSAIKFEPDNMLAVNYRGMIMARLGKVEFALAEYEKACQGGLELGCEYYRKIRGYSPKDNAAIAKIKLSEAKNKLSEKNWDGAVTSATEAIHLSPESTAAYVTRSGAYANGGHLPEALADAETAIRKNPDEGMGYTSRGYVYELMKNPRQAKLDYEIACSLKSEIGCANLNLSNTEDKQLQAQVQIRKELEQVQKATPQETGKTKNKKETVPIASSEPVMVKIPGTNIEIGKYLVTQGEWRALMGNNPSYFSTCDVTCPVESVSWDDVQEFIEKLNLKTGKRYRLPTELEWEVACFGGTHAEYCGGNDLDSIAWYNGNSNSQTHPVGQKKPNSYGLYDMTGNLWEWMSDCPSGKKCGSRSIRGGSWMDAPQYQRAVYRDKGSTEFRNFFIGFRLARTLSNCNEVGLGYLRKVLSNFLPNQNDQKCE
jgi:tetratricopeptide (TPR) repeat protein